LSGCDNAPWSEKVYDACGVCGGDGVCQENVVSSSSNKSSSSATVAIAAGVAGGVVFIIALVAIAFFIKRRRDSQPYRPNEVPLQPIYSPPPPTNRPTSPTTNRPPPPPPVTTNYSNIHSNDSRTPNIHSSYTPMPAPVMQYTAIDTGLPQKPVPIYNSRNNNFPA
jgi:hypothetical protein